MNGSPVLANRPPLNFSNVIDRVRRVLFGHYRLFLALGSVPAGTLVLSIGTVFLTLYALGLFPDHGAPPDPVRFVWIFLPLVTAAMLPTMVAYVLLEGASCVATLAVESGMVCSFSDAMTAAWHRLGRLLWLVILRYVYVALPAMGIFGVLALAMLSVGKHASLGLWFPLAALAALSYLGALVYAVWMTLRLCVAIPACMAEELGASDALDRSAQLTRGSLGRIFLVYLVVYAISYAGMMVVEVGGMIVGSIGSLTGALMGLHSGQPATMAVLAMFSVVGFLALMAIMALMWSAYGITCAVVYADRQGPTGERSQPLPGGGPT